MTERFHSAVVHNEVTRLVRANTRDVLDIAEALRFLIGERLDPRVRRDYKVRCCVFPGDQLLTICCSISCFGLLYLLY